MKTYTITLPIWLSRMVRYIHPDDRPLAFYRQAARSAIKELVFVLEILAISAGAVAAGILAKSELLKQGGVALIIIALAYVLLLLPLRWPKPNPSWSYAGINIAYQLIKITGLFALSGVFSNWMIGLVETALQLSP